MQNRGSREHKTYFYHYYIIMRESNIDFVEKKTNKKQTKFNEKKIINEKMNSKRDGCICIFHKSFCVGESRTHSKKYGRETKSEASSSGDF